MRVKEEYWAHLDKVKSLTKEQRKILKKFERGIVVGTSEWILIYELNPDTKKILGGLQCEIVVNE